MKAEQLSIFLENKPGRIAAVTEALATQNINIRALSLADTVDFGVLRLITDQPEKARQALFDGGFKAQVTEVLAVDVPDKPGALFRILEVFAKENLNVEYMYSLVARSDKGAVMIFRLDNLERALNALPPELGRLVPSKELYSY